MEDWSVGSHLGAGNKLLHINDGGPFFNILHHSIRYENTGRSSLSANTKFCWAPNVTRAENQKCPSTLEAFLRPMKTVRSPHGPPEASCWAKCDSVGVQRTHVEPHPQIKNPWISRLNLCILVWIWLSPESALYSGPAVSQQLCHLSRER